MSLVEVSTGVVDENVDVVKFGLNGIECVLDGFIAGYVYCETFSCAVAARDGFLKSCNCFVRPAHVPTAANENMVWLQGSKQCLRNFEA